MTKNYAAILIALAVAVVMMFIARDRKRFFTNEGVVWTTEYHITYEASHDLGDSIQLIFNNLDMSVSPYNKASLITSLNENTSSRVDAYVKRLMAASTEVNRMSGGAFDPTVMPLVNAWGFGYKSGKMPSRAQLDSILVLVGMDKVKLVGRKIVKADPRIMLDCSAIAKGYAVDKIALMLKRKGVENFLVEVGGERVAAGTNPKGKEWSIGVTKPVDDSLSVNSDLQMILTMTDCALATSGNYRNYYVKDGHKYAHTINPKTGNPAESNSLSATIVAPSCAEADAYATACMVVGKDKALQILNRQADKKYIIIYDNNGKTEWVVSPELKLTDK